MNVCSLSLCQPSFAWIGWGAPKRDVHGRHQSEDDRAPSSCSLPESACNSHVHLQIVLCTTACWSPSACAAPLCFWGTKDLSVMHQPQFDCWTHYLQPSLIITTPITYGAAHVAEALGGVPLHVISAVPWLPSKVSCWEVWVKEHTCGLPRMAPSVNFKRARIAHTL